jgi:hypothetical protein
MTDTRTERIKDLDALAARSSLTSEGWGGVVSPEDSPPKVSENYPSICNSESPWASKGLTVAEYFEPVTATLAGLNDALKGDDQALAVLKSKEVVDSLTRVVSAAGFVVSVKEIAKVNALLALLKKEEHDATKRLQHSKR